ncbi:hypothetical protein G7Y79_00046g082490 [Physcia stellaris]|nr:hypothetical protein G7Y79_00046g082490 [Physcia stellaris]
MGNANLQTSHLRKLQAKDMNIVMTKFSVATRTHKRHGRPSEQLRGFSLQNGKQKKNAISGSASKASSITKPLFVHQNHPRNAWDLSKKRARLNARNIQYTSLARSFAIEPHGKSGYAHSASLHSAESAPSGKKRKWDGDSSENSESKRPCSEPARKFKTPTFKIASEQEVQLKMFQEKPKRIVTWLEQLEPESYERMGSPTIEDSQRSSSSRSPAPSLHSQDVTEKTNGPPESTQQRLEQPCARNSYKPNPILQRSEDTSESSTTELKQRFVKAKSNLIEAYRLIGAHCSALGLGQEAGDIAKAFYSEIYHAAAVPDRPIPAITAACVYMAVRTLGESRTLRHIFNYAVQQGKEEYGNYTNLTLSRSGLEASVLQVFSIIKEHLPITLDPSTIRDLALLSLASSTNAYTRKIKGQPIITSQKEEL